MKLLLLRHGPVNVPAGLCYGRLDVPFQKPAATWIVAARHFVQSYLSADFDCWSSPSLRARHTAGSLAQSGTSVHDDERLCELHFGAFEGRLWQDISPAESQKWTDNAEVIPCPDGESYAALKARVLEWLHERMEQKRHVLAVCHGGPIRAVMQHAQAIPWSQLFHNPVDFASFTGLQIHKNTFTVDFSNRILPGYTGSAL